MVEKCRKTLKLFFDQIMNDSYYKFEKMAVSIYCKPSRSKTLKTLNHETCCTTTMVVPYVVDLLKRTGSLESCLTKSHLFVNQPHLSVSPSRGVVQKCWEFCQIILVGYFHISGRLHMLLIEQNISSCCQP